MPSLVNLVDQLHQDYRIGHFSSSIVQDGVDVPLIVTDQRNVEAARSSWLPFHQQENQEQRAVELDSCNALLGVTILECPRVRSPSDLVLEPVHLQCLHLQCLSGCTEV